MGRSALSAFLRRYAGAFETSAAFPTALWRFRGRVEKFRVRVGPFLTRLFPGSNQASTRTSGFKPHAVPFLTGFCSAFSLAGQGQTLSNFVQFPRLIRLRPALRGLSPAHSRSKPDRKPLGAELETVQPGLDVFPAAESIKDIKPKS